MRCRSVLTRLDALRTGELSDREQQSVHEHLETCPTCSASADDVRGLASLFKSAMPAPPRDAYERIGEVFVAFSDKGLRMLRHGGTLEEFTRDYAKRYGRTLQAASMPETLRKQVVAALEGAGVSRPRVDWSESLTDLEKRVLDLLTHIPRGEVRTYEWIARHAGSPKAVRAVGSICTKNVLPFVVPCHRVVPSTGGIGNYAFGSAMKRDLLAREGVDVERLESLAKKGVRYIGSKTTKIVCNPTCRDAKRIREENRVPFRAAGEAVEKGFRPCMHCEPFAA